MNQLQKIKYQYQELKTEAKLIDKQIINTQQKIEVLVNGSKSLQDTKNILLEAIKIINERFKQKLELVATNIVQKVFQRNIKIVVDYEEKAYGVETKIKIIENGIELDFEDDMGGSIIEIISLITRLILKEMSSTKLRNTIILDEPFNWAGSLITLIAQIIKEFSKNIQFIILTHDRRLEDIADRIYRIERQFNISKVTKER